MGCGYFFVHSHITNLESQATRTADLFSVSSQVILLGSFSNYKENDKTGTNELMWRL